MRVSEVDFHVPALIPERFIPDVHNRLIEYKRIASAHTRSNERRRCRDTFASLKKTCNKLGIAFWDYLLDRVSLKNAIPYLPDLIRGTATISM